MAISQFYTQVRNSVKGNKDNIQKIIKEELDDKLSNGLNCIVEDSDNLNDQEPQSENLTKRVNPNTEEAAA